MNAITDQRPVDDVVMHAQFGRAAGDDWSVDMTCERGDVGGPAAYEAHKRDLIGSLRETVLEIGAGRGANFVALRQITHWIGVEPSHRGRVALRRAVGRRSAEVVDGRAEFLPIAAASVDAVLSTIVLCSVRDHAGALAEVERVLRPAAGSSSSSTWRLRPAR